LQTGILIKGKDGRKTKRKGLSLPLYLRMAVSSARRLVPRRGETERRGMQLRKKEKREDKEFRE